MQQMKDEYQQNQWLLVTEPQVPTGRGTILPFSNISKWLYIYLLNNICWHGAYHVCNILSTTQK